MELTIDNFNLNLLNTYAETIADGDGLRYSIYLAGCRHGCRACHNRQSWNPKAGIALTDKILKNIIQRINDNPLLDGITLSGGDPFFNPEALHTLLQILTIETGKNIWCYTGYTYEQLLQDTTMKACLSYIDTLVDGQFEIEKFNPHLHFRGSSNQRIIYLKPNTHEIESILTDDLADS